MAYVPQHTPHENAMALARGLGWFSIALGAVEVLAPKALGRALGMERHAGLLRAYGAREIATGIAILASADPKPWVWGRVAGDAIDLATLMPGLIGNRRRAEVGVALGAVTAATAVDLYCARRLGETGGSHLATHDYSDRSGFPKAPALMRGAARKTNGSGNTEEHPLWRAQPNKLHWSPAPPAASGSSSRAASPKTGIA